MGLKTWGWVSWLGWSWVRKPGPWDLQAQLLPSQVLPRPHWEVWGLRQPCLPAAPRLGAASAEPVGIKALAPACAPGSIGHGVGAGSGCPLPWGLPHWLLLPGTLGPGLA